MSARTLLPLVLLLSVLCADAGHAGLAACDSADRKTSPDDRIRLYTLCITNGQVHRWEIAYALSHRAEAYIRKDELDLALGDLNQSLSLDADHKYPYQLRAYIWGRRMQWDFAERDLTMIVARAPRREQADAYRNRGAMRICRGTCADALLDFDKAIAINPKLTSAYLDKAWVLSTCADERARNGAEAVSVAQQALSLQDAWWSHATLAAAFAEAGQFSDSVREIGLAQTTVSGKNSSARDRRHLAEEQALYEASRPYREQNPERYCAPLPESDGEASE